MKNYYVRYYFRGIPNIAYVADAKSPADAAKAFKEAYPSASYSIASVKGAS